MSDDTVCSFCGRTFGNHEQTCPYNEHPTWQTIPDPDAKNYREDKAYRDLREEWRETP